MHLFMYLGKSPMRNQIEFVSLNGSFIRFKHPPIQEPPIVPESLLLILLEQSYEDRGWLCLLNLTAV